jgi:hypothetical protein
MVVTDYYLYTTINVLKLSTVYVNANDIVSTLHLDWQHCVKKSSDFTDIFH